MALCKVDMLVVGSICREAGLEDVLGRWAPAEAQNVAVRAKVDKRGASGRVLGTAVGFRCNATSGDGQPKKNYDVNKVVEKVVHEEENQLPEEEKKTPEPMPEGEPSPFSPAIDKDETEAEAFQGEGLTKDSLIVPPRGLQEGAASALIGEAFGASEESALTANIGSSPVSGPGGRGRDWRVQSSRESSKGLRLKAFGSKANLKQKEYMSRPSEVSCDDGSSFMAEVSISETNGGRFVDDYKLRAHIFSESAVFFSVPKERVTRSVV